MVTLIHDSVPRCHIGPWLRIKYKEVSDSALPLSLQSLALNNSVKCVTGTKVKVENGHFSPWTKNQYHQLEFQIPKSLKKIYTNMWLFSLVKRKCDFFLNILDFFFSSSDILNIVCFINCIESFMCFFMLNGKTLSTVLNNQLCKKINNVRYY